MSFESTYHWEKPIHTGVIFGSVLALLISICYFSLISVAAYASLALLLVKKIPARGTFYCWELFLLGTFLLGTFSYWERLPAGLFLSDQIKNAFPEARDLFRNNILRFSCDDRARASLKFLSFSCYGFLLSSLILVSSEHLLP